MKTKRHLGVGLVVAVAATIAMALAAGPASATIVVPPSTAIKQSLETGTAVDIYFDNGYAPLWLSCSESTAKFTTPSGRTAAQDKKGERVGNDNNINRTSIGTHSTGPGSVTMNLTEPPTFTGCSLILEGTPIAEATIETSEANGHWSIAAEEETKAKAVAAIAVPKLGAVVTVPTLGCTIEFFPAESTAVFGHYTNATHTLKVDGQLSLKETGCSAVGALEPPAQFEATYVANHELEIKP